MRFEQKKITICNALLHKEAIIPTKKILISLFVFSALLVSGYNYFKSSSLKHREFLLNQALLPSFTRAVQSQNISVTLKKVILNESNFTLILVSPEKDPILQKNIEEKVSGIVRDWQETQKEFKNFDFQITFENQIDQ